VVEAVAAAAHKKHAPPTAVTSAEGRASAPSLDSVEPWSIRLLRTVTLCVFVGLVVGLALDFAYPERVERAVAVARDLLRPELEGAVSWAVWAARLVATRGAPSGH
jgi:hypothetical protein